MITPFYSQNADLLVDVDKSALKEDVVRGADTIDIYSINKFAVNLVLCIGKLGSEGSEIVKTHSSTAPSGYTVTLLNILEKDHPKDTPVYIIPYDQVEFSHANTTTGDKTVLDTYDIDPEREGNRHSESAETDGFVFTRFKNSINVAYSNYSDPYPFAGLDGNTVGYLIKDASEELDKEGVIPFDKKVRIINKGMRYIRGQLKRWNTFQEFDNAVDQTERGKYEYDVPTTLYDKNSNKSVLTVRIGSDNYLKYLDKRELVTKLKDSIHTTVATQPSIGDTTLVVANGYNLASSGSVNLYYNGTAYDVDYTGITRSTGTLTGIATSGDGSVEVAFPVGTHVWYGEREGKPTRYTVYDGNLALSPMPDADYDDMDIFMDFYTDIVEVDSDTDTISFERYDMLSNYLKWEIRNIIERNGKKDYTDGDWIMFKDILKDAVRRETSGQKYKQLPRINRIADTRGGGLPFDRS